MEKKSKVWFIIIAIYWERNFSLLFLLSISSEIQEKNSSFNTTTYQSFTVFLAYSLKHCNISILKDLTHIKVLLFYNLCLSARDKTGKWCLFGIYCLKYIEELKMITNCISKITLKLWAKPIFKHLFSFSPLFIHHITFQLNVNLPRFNVILT